MKKKQSLLKGLFIVIGMGIMSLVYMDYEILAVIGKFFTIALQYLTTLWYALWAWLVHGLKSIVVLLKARTPTFLWNFITRKFLKPLWSLLALIAIALLGPQVIKWLKEHQRHALVQAKLAYRKWKVLSLFVRVPVIASVAGILYLLGFGILLPLLGFSIILSMLQSILLVLTDVFVDNKTKTLRERWYTLVRRLRMLRAVHNRYHTVQRKLVAKARKIEKERTDKKNNGGKS